MKVYYAFVMNNKNTTQCSDNVKLLSKEVILDYGFQSFYRKSPESKIIISMTYYHVVFNPRIVLTLYLYPSFSPHLLTEDDSSLSRNV